MLDSGLLSDFAPESAERAGLGLADRRTVQRLE
jgi:hypothetical protein